MTATLCSRVLCARLPDEEAPTEFRLFKAGKNETTKGVFVFDQAAAARVMATYQTNGVDVMIDLEHLSFEDPAATPRTDTKDARGWAKLALRNGELWAVDVRWTPDGLERLASKKQRYISPAFARDDAGNVLELYNIALCSEPATHSTPALVAAAKQLPGTKTKVRHTTSARRQRASEKLNRMTPEQVKQGMALVAEDPENPLAQFVADMIAQQAAGGDAGSEPAGDALADTAETPPADDDKDKPQAVAATVIRLSKVAQDATKAAEDANKQVKELTERLSKIESERAASDGAERVKLVGELVKLGVEFPATAWDGAPEKKKPVARLASESIESLRSRVELHRKHAPARGHAPPDGDAETVQLSKQEQDAADKIKDPDAKARFIAARLAKKGK